MFTEAASLDTHSQGDWLNLVICELFRHLRSVVIITIDVKHLISLDTENTAYRKYQSAVEKEKWRVQDSIIPRQHTLRQTCNDNGVSMWSSGGVACSSRGRYIPVPSTTTSYSAAMSSMMEEEGEV